MCMSRLELNSIPVNAKFNLNNLTSDCELLIISRQFVNSNGNNINDLPSLVALIV